MIGFLKDEKGLLDEIFRIESVSAKVPEIALEDAWL